MQRVRDHVGLPCAQAAPAVQDGNREGLGLRFLPRGLVVEGPELGDDLLHSIDELRMLQSEAQVSAVADSIQRRADDGSTCGQPRLVGLPDRISVRVEDVREEVRKETALGVTNTGNVGDHPARGTRTDRADDRVQACLREVRPVRLDPNPVVAQEHDGFLACTMHLIDECFHAARDEPVLERDPVEKRLGRRSEGRVVVALVDEIFRGQRVAHLGFECFQCGDGDGSAIAEPVDETFLGVLTVDEREVIEEGRESDDVDLRMVPQPRLEALPDVVPSLGMPHVERHLLLPRRVALPTVGEVVVHLGRIPELHGQEPDRVDVPCAGIVDLDDVLPDQAPA